MVLDHASELIRSDVYIQYFFYEAKLTHPIILIIKKIKK
jgi:hypothetical protein